MHSIHILSERGRVNVCIDGAELNNLHSFSVDYLRGAPLLVSLVAEIGGDQKTEHKLFH